MSATSSALAAADDHQTQPPPEFPLSPESQVKQQEPNLARAESAVASDGEIPETDTSLAYYTDGSFKEPHWGGCGVAYVVDGHWAGRAVSMGPTSSNTTAELCAIHETLLMAEEQHHAAESRRVIVYTDSQTSIHYLTGAKGPRAASKSTVDKDLLERTNQQHARLVSLGLQVQFEWVRGHSGEPGNVLADKMARNAMEMARDGARGPQNHPDLNSTERPFTAAERAAKEQTHALQSEEKKLRKRLEQETPTNQRRQVGMAEPRRARKLSSRLDSQKADDSNDENDGVFGQSANEQEKMSKGKRRRISKAKSRMARKLSSQLDSQKEDDLNDERDEKFDQSAIEQKDTQRNKRRRVERAEAREAQKLSYQSDSQKADHFNDEKDEKFDQSAVEHEGSLGNKRRRVDDSQDENNEKDAFEVGRKSGHTGGWEIRAAQRACAGALTRGMLHDFI